MSAHYGSTTGLIARIALVCLCAYVCICVHVCVCERERGKIAFISFLMEFVISVENTKDKIEISKICAL